MQNLKNVKSKLYHIETSKANSVDLDEVAHFEPPHQDYGSLFADSDIFVSGT